MTHNRTFTKDPSTITNAEITLDMIQKKQIGAFPENGKDPSITYDGEWLIGHAKGYKMAGASLECCLNEAILPVINAPGFILLENREIIVENLHTLWGLI